jgi:hypothetical protein
MSEETMIMQRLGLISALALSTLAAPGAASAAGWVYVAPAPRVYTRPAPRVYVAPTRVYTGQVPRGYAADPYGPARTRVWVPGYWGLRGDTRVWVAGNYSYPPFAGWAWVAPQWTWNGYQWVWQEGYWAPPAY